MTNYILKILLTISLFFNVTLYFWIIQVNEFRDYVDNFVSESEEFINSEEFQNILSNTEKVLSDIYDESLSAIIDNTKEDILKYGEEKAKQAIEEKFKELWEDEVWALIEKAKSQIESEKSN